MCYKVYGVVLNGKTRISFYARPTPQCAVCRCNSLNILILNIHTVTFLSTVYNTVKTHTSTRICPHKLSIVCQSYLTYTTMRQPESVCIQLIATAFQSNQSLLHILLLTTRRVSCRQTAQSTALIRSEKNRTGLVDK